MLLRGVDFEVARGSIFALAWCVGILIAAFLFANLSYRRRIS